MADKVLTGKMVLGFMFSEDRERVLLIRKTRPAWMAGKLNGVGGAVEDGETVLAAMCREFAEETGVDGTVWRLVGRMEGRNAAGSWTVYVLATDGDIDDINPADDEAESLEIADVSALPANVLPNLRWLVPLCLDEGGADLQGVPPRFTVAYDD